MRRALRVLLPLSLMGALGLLAMALIGFDGLPHIDLGDPTPAPSREAPGTAIDRAADVSTAQPPPPSQVARLIAPAAIAPASTPSSEPASRAAPADAKASSSQTVAAGAPRIAASALRIEVARIDPEGVSVLAGSAPAGSRVSIMANGKTIGETTVSSEGQWSAVLTTSFAPGSLDLSIASDAARVAGARSPSVIVVVPKPTGRVELAAASSPPRLAPTPSEPRAEPKAVKPRPDGAQALGDFAALVDRARLTGRPEQATSTNGATATAATRSATPAAAPAVPVPITFVTGEATMTAEGARAAALLVEYLRILRPAAITLSGHADVRGSDGYNLDLSRQRLEAIERHVRSHGYTGRLALLPKGRSEPYRGIDRRAAGLEAIHQADRRVELRLAE